MISYLKPSDKILRRMGFFIDQEGIYRRFLDESDGWNEHINKTKDFIKRTLELYTPKNVAIFGSGWLLDIPIDLLASTCEKVYLYDIRHPRQILHKFRDFKNLIFVISDLTGGIIEETYHLVKNSKKGVPTFDTINPKPFIPYESVDFTFSVNVLNQLDIMVIEYLRKKKVFDPTIHADFRKKIQLAHLMSLPTGKSAIITDYMEMLYDRTDKFVENRDLLYIELPQGRRKSEWIWKFDQNMSYYPNRKTYFKVIAIDI